MYVLNLESPRASHLQAYDPEFLHQSLDSFSSNGKNPARSLTVLAGICLSMGDPSKTDIVSILEIVSGWEYVGSQAHLLSLAPGKVI